MACDSPSHVTRGARRPAPEAGAVRSRRYRRRQVQGNEPLAPVQIMVPARFRGIVILVGRILREAARADVSSTAVGRKPDRYRKARLRLVRHLLILKTEVLKERGDE